MSVTTRNPDGSRRRRRLDEISVTGTLDERRKADGRRRISLTRSERQIMQRSRLVEASVALFLDLEGDHSWAQIAEELGISVRSLKDLVKSEDFVQCYNMHFAELGHDPRLRATQAELVDMLPAAVRELRKIVVDPQTPAGVRLKAIERVMQLNGVTASEGKESDQAELNRFLHGVNVNGDVNITVQANPFAEQIQSYVEGRFEEIPTHETPGNPRLPSGEEE